MTKTETELTEIQKLKNIIANIKLQQTETQAKLAEIDKNADKTRVEVGIELLGNPKATTQKLDDLLAERERLNVVSQALAYQLETKQSELQEAVNAKAEKAREALLSEVEKIHSEMIKGIYGLYQLACKLTEIDRKYKQTGVRGYLSQGISIGVPYVDVLNKTDIWLTNAATGDKDSIAILEKQGIPSRRERDEQRRNAF